jgi:mannose-6-phosphate isomerase-like protein (cupin superfamily)
MDDEEDSCRRPWGHFEVLLSASHCKVKRLAVAPGQRLSLQRHRHRDETWVVVRGEGVAEVEDAVPRRVACGDVVRVPRGATHRLAASADGTLEVVEVQTGDGFDEGDIERLADDYGR